LKLREIERLRACAILLVIFAHWGNDINPLLIPMARNAWSGVDLFFVISGFVVTLSLVRLLPDLGPDASFPAAFEHSKQALKTFYARRFFRILPAALAAAILHRLLIPVFPEQFGTAEQWLREIVAFLGGVYNYYFPAAGTGLGQLGVYWSLAVEEHFYLILPMLFVALRTTGKRLGACLAVILVTAFVLRPMGMSEMGGLNVAFYERFSSHFRFDSLMAGVALALVYGGTFGRPILPPWFVRLVIVPACVVLIGCLPGVVAMHVMHRVGFIALYLLSAVLVGYASLDRGYVFSFPLVGRVLEYVGSRSYALYLIHFDLRLADEGLRKRFVAYGAFYSNNEGGALLHFFVLLAAALLVAEVLHRTIEKPFMRLGRRLMDPARPAPDEEAVQAQARWRPYLGTAAVFAALLVALRHPLLELCGPRNLALGRPVNASSVRRGNGELTNGLLEDAFGQHTEQDDGPWEEIDLGAPTTIRAVRVYNRADGWEQDQIPLELFVSDDGLSYRQVARRTMPFSQALPWCISTGPISARFVRLRVPNRTTMCLSEVEVYDSAIAAYIP
jgi:peptidoglycan/LPS O-acetylase OafA/YrhL